MSPPCPAAQFNFLVGRRLVEQVVQPAECSLFGTLTALRERFPLARQLICKQWKNQWEQARQRASKILEGRRAGGQGRAGQQGEVVVGA